MLKHLSAFLLAATLLAAPAAAEPVIGQPAPDFEATDSNGTTIKLSELKGKPIVLEWTNDKCPFVVKYYKSGTMQQVQRTATSMGATWLTVNSSAPGKQGHVDADGANALMTTSNATPAHYLLDPNGTIGRAYDAKTTPHMYVIDAEGTLVYMGAIDDKPTADIADIDSATNYVLAALTSLKDGKPIEPASTQPYGCNVKY